MSKSHGTACAIGLVSATLLACADPPAADDGPETCLDRKGIGRPDLPIAYETEHLDIHIDEGQFVCAGSAREYERFVSYVAEELGIEIQRRIPMYAMASVADYCASTGGCTTASGAVYSRPISSYHELAHGVACEVQTEVPAILAEGFAVSLEPDPKTSMGSPELFAEIPSSEFGKHYFDAGHFVRALFERDGPEAFAELYRTATYTDGVWAAIEAMYGVEVGVEYADASPVMWLPHRQCEAVPMLEPGGAGWDFSARLDCDDVETLGPYERVGEGAVKSYGGRSMYQSFLIEVQEPGTYFVEQSGTTWINYEQCLDDHLATKDDVKAWVDTLVWFNFQGLGMIDLDPGIWRFDVLADHGPAVDVSVTITPDPG